MNINENALGRLLNGWRKKQPKNWYNRRVSPCGRRSSVGDTYPGTHKTFSRTYDNESIFTARDLIIPLS